ncbi:MAG TPA: spore coat U domain-containing protein [Candidatus Baltobacteraceae bacterium]
MRTIRTAVAIALMAALLWVVPNAVSAGSSTGTLTVTASVAQNCIVSSPTLAFGAYDPVVANLSANDDQSTTIVLTCTKGASGITLGFGNSANAPAGCTAPQRCLVSSGHYMNYQLYSDSGRSSVWTTAIAETVSGGVTTPTNVTIYGRIPSGQDASIGAAYTDSVTATVNF